MFGVPHNTKRHQPLRKGPGTGPVEEFQVAFQMCQAGRLSEAEGVFRKLRRFDPSNGEVLHLLGLIAYPHAPSYRNLGNAFRDKESVDEAIGAYKRAIELKADFVEARNDLGNVLKNAGRLAEAIGEYEAAIALRPGYSEAHCNLGNIYREEVLTEKAIDCSRAALRTKPLFAEVMSNLGNAFKDQGDLTNTVFRRSGHRCATGFGHRPFATARALPGACSPY
jgi:protein O-GlcNAc transferase